MDKILVFDTETTGLIPKECPGLDSYFSYTDTKRYEQCRLVSICWQVYSVTGTLLLSKYYIIKPRDFIIDNSSKATEIHGITHEISQDGVDIGHVLSDLKDDLNDVKLLVAHNIVFDTNILMSELFRYNQTELLEHIKTIDTYCTCRNGETVTKIKPLGWRNYKIPKLCELYKFLFNEELDNQHNALADTQACARCFFKMIK